MDRADSVSELEIGRYYLVDTVVRSRDGVVLPTHGPLHDDAAIVGFPYKHWHIDWRFVSAKEYREYQILGRSKQWMPWAWPINEEHTTGVLSERRMIAKREFGPYMPPGWVPWQQRLEERYRESRMKNFICPHKGLPCNATPIVDGVVVCRGHGLAFKVETGELVPRGSTEVTPKDV